jgi:hypothetical protein
MDPNSAFQADGLAAAILSISPMLTHVSIYGLALDKAAAERQIVGQTDLRSEAMPRNSSPTIQAFSVRAVRVPMAEPHRTASGVITKSPLVLTDVITDAGISGHSLVSRLPQ